MGGERTRDAVEVNDSDGDERPVRAGVADWARDSAGFFGGGIMRDLG